MRLALASARLGPDEVEYVNAHGSSTPLGDRAEAVALAGLFGERVGRVPVSGTKPHYGHPLGASGAIEAAVVALALFHQKLPVSLNLCSLEPGSPEARLHYVGSATCQRGARVALSNSFGFGGINACLALRQWEGQ